MKNNYLLAFIAFLLFTGKTFAQCTETPQPKVLLVGDSWAWFMNTEATINNVFKTWGFSDFRYVSNATLAVNGAQTDDFMQAATQAEILHQLTINPTIEVVHLSIGGNDFLGDWKVSMTQGQVDTLENNVFERLDSVIRFIKTCKPGIKILWSGYVYPNFGEVIPTGGGANHPFYGTWEGMEFPTFIQINTLLNSVSTRMQTYVNNDPQLAFVPCTGLMQYIYGQNPALAVAPGGTYPAHSVPMPLGDPNYPSPKAAMRDYFGLTKDAFHLSTDGYKELINYHTQKFYHTYLMDDLYLLSENNAQTGSVSSTGTVSDSLFVGATGNEQFATVLSFNTTTMADTTLNKASLFLRRMELTGTNPVGGNMLVKVKNGNFGATVNVEAADFAAADDANATPCQFGSNTANGDWIRLDLPTSLYPYINKNGTTQFIVSAPSASNGKTKFYNSNDPEFAPVLNLKYGQTPSGINEATATVKFDVYPNPTTGKLTIENSNEVITSVAVTNLLGEVVLQPKMQQGSIDISSLASGMYILNITTLKGKGAQRIFKN